MTDSTPPGGPYGPSTGAGSVASAPSSGSQTDAQPYGTAHPRGAARPYDTALLHETARDLGIARIHASPPAAGTASTASGSPTKQLGVLAFTLAVVGAAMALIPIIAFFSGILLLTAFVLSLIALISRKHVGGGFGVAALIISVSGWLISIVVGLISFAML
ncbi:hypothetical protein [Microbacterium sp. CFBP9034]|uniref:hypothetical protein n=1 Tax=Microbacterium sp. CFBP9034 TaxID=3096540 RepID=UPI002A6B6809|nr:hypothetical protein [Microbacterium sp. CFBP9034]MDY0910669.1 hypothetical protein [Microbacterium sp. CFBP9034]